MFVLFIVAISAALTTFCVTPFFRNFFGFLQMVDRPDSGRKLHARPVPRVGGIPVALSYLLAFALLAVWRGGGVDWTDPSVRLTAKLLPAVLLIFGAGLWDDFHGLRPWHKLACELLAAAYACLIGVRMATPPGHPLLAVTMWLVSAFWLVLCANAINLIDGLDGLATGVALLASISLLLAAAIHNHAGLAIVIAPLVGCLAGFLIYNFNPATIFLGDSGSLVIGFLLGCYGLLWHRHATSSLGQAAPLIALAFPVLEVLLSIVRRFLRNHPVFGADRNHIHHRILSMGLSHRNAVLLLWGGTAVAALLALLQTILHPRLGKVLLVMFCFLILGALRWLGYKEFGVLGKFLFFGQFVSALQLKIHLADFEHALARAQTPEECWQVLKAACREAQFSGVALKVGAQSFEDNSEDTSNDSNAGHLHISIADSVTVIFSHDRKLSMPAMLIAPFVHALKAKFEEATSPAAPHAANDEPALEAVNPGDGTPEPKLARRAMANSGRS